MNIAIFRSDKKVYDYDDTAARQVTDWHEVTPNERRLLSVWLTSVHPHYMVVDQLGKEEVASTIKDCLQAAEAYNEAQQAQAAAAEENKRNWAAKKAAKKAEEEKALFQKLKEKYEKTVDGCA